MAYLGREPAVGRYALIDDISSQFNGSETSFVVKVGGDPVSIVSDAQLLVSLGGVLQKPGTDFNIAPNGGSLTFTTAPENGDPFFGILFGDTLNVGVPSDGTIDGRHLKNSLSFSGKTVSGGTFTGITLQSIGALADFDGDITTDKVSANTVHVAKKLTSNVSGTNILTTQGPITTPKITANVVNGTAANFTTLQADSIDFDGDLTVDKVTANTIHTTVKITANTLGTNIMTAAGPITAAKVSANSFSKIVTAGPITTPSLTANTITADGGLSIDNITIDGTDISLSSGNLKIDSAADIILDADGGEVLFHDNAVATGHVSMDSSNLTIKSLVSDKDIIFQGNDGGSGITALTLDMSEAGAAAFNAGATFASGCTITTADNNVQLTLKSTDDDANSGPILDLVRDSASPADGDEVGVIRFKFDDDAGEVNTAARFTAKINDASNGTEDGELEIVTLINGSSRSRIELLPTATVFNEDSQDIDFRVESDAETHALFVQAGSSCVGIKTASPNDYYSDELVITCDDEGGMTFVTGTTHGNYINFADGTSGNAAYRGFLKYDHNNDTMTLGTSAASAMTINADGALNISSQPGFLAFLASTHNNVTGDATTYYSSDAGASYTEVYDTAANFDGAGTFTAPVTGKYLVCVNVMFEGLTANHSSGVFYIFTSNRTYSRLFHPRNMANVNTNIGLPMAQICDVDSGDTIRWGLYVNFTDKTIDITTTTNFGAQLIS